MLLLCVAEASGVVSILKILSELLYSQKELIFSKLDFTAVIKQRRH